MTGTQGPTHQHHDDGGDDKPAGLYSLRIDPNQPNVTEGDRLLLEWLGEIMGVLPQAVIERHPRLSGLVDRSLAYLASQYAEEIDLDSTSIDAETIAYMDRQLCRNPRCSGCQKIRSQLGLLDDGNHAYDRTEQQTNEAHDQAQQEAAQIIAGLTGQSPLQE